MVIIDVFLIILTYIFIIVHRSLDHCFRFDTVNSYNWDLVQCKTDFGTEPKYDNYGWFFSRLDISYHIISMQRSHDCMVLFMFGIVTLRCLRAWYIRNRKFPCANTCFKHVLVCNQCGGYVLHVLVCNQCGGYVLRNSWEVLMNWLKSWDWFCIYIIEQWKKCILTHFRS